MACLEHACECGHVFFTNGESDGCPKCGSLDYSTHFDEPGDDLEQIRSEIYEDLKVVEREPTVRDVMEFREKAAGEEASR